MNTGYSACRSTGGSARPCRQLWGMTDRPGGGDSDFFSSR